MTKEKLKLKPKKNYTEFIVRVYHKKGVRSDIPWLLNWIGLRLNTVYSGERKITVKKVKEQK